MKKYKVEITETLQRIVEVDADNERDAILKVKDMYHSEEVVLDDTHYIDTEFDIFLD